MDKHTEHYVRSVVFNTQSDEELAFIQLIHNDLKQDQRPPTLYEKAVIIPRLARNLFLLTSEYNDLIDKTFGGTVDEGTDGAMDRQSPRFKNYKEIQAMVEKDEKALNLSFDSKKVKVVTDNDEDAKLESQNAERKRRLNERAEKRQTD